MTPTVESRLPMATLNRFFLLNAGSSDGSAYGRIERWTIVGGWGAEGNDAGNPTPVDRSDEHYCASNTPS